MTTVLRAGAWALALAVQPPAAGALNLAALAPTNGSGGVCADTLLRLTFDGAAIPGTSGAVRIYRADGALVDMIDLASNAVDGTQPRVIGGGTYNAYPVLPAGNAAVVYPNPGRLAYNQTYYVLVDAGVFPGFAGIGDPLAWRFTTKAAGPAAGSDYLVVEPDSAGDFCTVQGAVDFVPANNTNRVYVNVRNGAYTEIVRINARHNLLFRGQNRKRTVIAYPNNSNLNPSTATRPVVNVQAHDIVFHNLSLSNSTPAGGSQAEALRVNGARCVVNDCDLHSFQDTLLVNSAGNTAYVFNSLVEGNADFIWGSGAVIFQGCEVKSRAGGYLCQMRTPTNQYGAVFLDCRLTGAAGATNCWLARIDPSVYPDSAAAFVNCAMGGHIAAAGWLLTAPGPTNALRFWEYQSTDLAGAPLNVGGRAAFSKQISAAQATALRNLTNVLGGWLPRRPLPAFPGAEGAGAFALGGRGGDVYYVTTLADSGAGSLRDAVGTAPAGGRAVLFKVSGTIELESPLRLTKRRLTLAGQTAPGGGVCVKNCSLRVQADDVVVRHLKTRLGTDRLLEDDALTVWDGVQVIIDHCSASWSVDEVLSATGNADDLTVQWTFITEALDNSIHSKGPHGYGSLLASYIPASYSLHHNLYAHNESRNPRPGSYNGAVLSFDFRNNVVYDWGFFAGYTAAAPEATDMNYVGNYLVKGPGTTRDSAFVGGDITTRIFQQGNKIDLNTNGVFDGTNSGWAMFSGVFTTQAAAFASALVATEAADAALQRVLSQGGSRPWGRDPVDARVAADVLRGTGGFVDTTAQAGGYPPLDTTAFPADTDSDGMPDYWESALGLDPAIAGNNLDRDGDGYSDLEEYLNWLAAPHAVLARNAAADLDLNALNGGRTNVSYAVSNATGGAVTLLADGHTARFTAASNFTGLAGFDFSFASPGGVIAQRVGVCVSDGFPSDLKWLGATPTWDVGVTTNFLQGATPAAFRPSDVVTFDDTGGASNVTLVGAIQPGGVVVAASRDYTFGGTGSLAGAMSLVKSGPGKLTLAASNTYRGGTFLSGGTLALGSAMGAGSGVIALAQAALSIGALKPPNRIDVAGTNAVSGGSGSGLAGCGDLTGDGTVNLTITTGVFDLFGDLSGFQGTLAVGAGGGLRMVGSTGSAAAVFDLGAGTANLYNRTGVAAVSLGALRGGSNTVVKGYSNGTNLTTYVVGAKGLDTTFAGSIRNGDGGGGTAPTALTKVGAGALTLGGSNLYTGATRVDGGLLVVNGSLGSTAVTVASNAALAGSGRIGGAVEVQPGARLLVGAAALTFGTGLVLTAGARTELALGTNTGVVAVGGNLSLGGVLAVTASAGFGAGTRTLFTYGGTLSGQLVVGGMPAGYRGVINTNVPGRVDLVVIRPQVDAIATAAGALLIAGRDGLAHSNYYVLAASNLALPAVQWLRIATNQFDALGKFSVMDTRTTNYAQKFYFIEVP